MAEQTVILTCDDPAASPAYDGSAGSRVRRNRQHDTGKCQPFIVPRRRGCHEVTEVEENSS